MDNKEDKKPEVIVRERMLEDNISDAMVETRSPLLYHVENKFFKKVEKESEIAKDKTDLRNEVILLRARLMELNERVNGGEPLISHYDRDGTPIPLGDKGVATMLTQLARAIAGLAKTDYDITLAPNVITQDEFLMWLGKLARAVRAVQNEDFKKIFVELMSEVGLPLQHKK